MNITNFIRGIGSVIDTYPTSGYIQLQTLMELYQKKDIKIDDNIRAAWLNAGNALRRAMSIVDGEKDKE
ncbi:MAG: hypothetical protein HQL06_17420 [Nitrospirae bacterium]|nr:hypothetical protein [Nitrospirota bacterium]